MYYLKLYLRSIRNRDWDKLNREKEEDLFMRESKMGDCNRHLNSKLFVPNNYSPINNMLKSQKLPIILLGFIGLAPNDHHLNPYIF